jgi:magnesium chelatase family protein
MISVARGYGRRTLPAAFQLVAATNPCRCGNLGAVGRACRCSPGDRRRYLGRLSGPLLDRFDLFLEVGSWAGTLPAEVHGGREATAARRGAGWRETARWSELAAAQTRLQEQAEFDGGAARTLDDLGRRLGLSLRSVIRCGRVARTIAALDRAARVKADHVQEALEFRKQAVAALGDPCP